jgi:hypothetical protein
MVELLMVEELKQDFRKFLYVIWSYLNLPEPTPVQYDIAKALQHGSKRLIIEAFRGIGKSWITSAFVVWLLFRNPDLKIMVVSATKERADQFSMFTKRLISDIDFLAELRPRSDQRNSLKSFDVGGASPDHSPSVKSASITGQLTGSRADIIIADDIEIPNNSMTQDARDKLAELVKEFDAILKPLPTSRIIYLGTPQTEMSIYNVLGERGYDTKIWTALKPSNEEVLRYNGKLADFILELDVPVGTSTDPKRFSDEDLQERLLSYGKAGFALQFMLDTTLSDADKYPLRLSDLIIDDIHSDKAPVDYSWSSRRDLEESSLPHVGLQGDRYYRPLWASPERLEYTGRVMAIDPSGRGKDETAYAIGFMLNGFIFVPSAGGMKEGYSDRTLKQLVQLAKRYKVHEVVIESNFGDGMFCKLIQPYFAREYPVTITEKKNNTRKEKRIIETLEPVMMQHRIIVDPKVVIDDYESASGDIQYSLFYQMSRIMDEKNALTHDDRLDAFALMVEYWKDQMDADAKLLEAQRQGELLEQELMKFIEEATGSKPSTHLRNWCYW